MIAAHVHDARWATVDSHRLHLMSLGNALRGPKSATTAFAVARADCFGGL